MILGPRRPPTNGASKKQYTNRGAIRGLILAHSQSNNGGGILRCGDTSNRKDLQTGVPCGDALVTDLKHAACSLHSALGNKSPAEFEVTLCPVHFAVREAAE